eukprot:2110123-Prorocentrum_lima.AAC.1
MGGQTSFYVFFCHGTATLPPARRQVSVKDAALLVDLVTLDGERSEAALMKGGLVTGSESEKNW